MLKQGDKQTVTQSRRQQQQQQQCRQWAGPACHLGGLGGGGLPPCSLASWLVLKRWLKITFIVWELLLRQDRLWPPRGRGSRSWYLPPPWALALWDQCPAGHSCAYCPPVGTRGGQTGPLLPLCPFVGRGWAFVPPHHIPLLPICTMG